MKSRSLNASAMLMKRQKNTGATTLPRRRTKIGTSKEKERVYKLTDARAYIYIYAIDVSISQGVVDVIYPLIHIVRHFM